MKMSHKEAGRLGALARRDKIRVEKEQRVELYNKNPTHCPICNKALSYEKRHNLYCSHSCAIIQNNKDKGRYLNRRDRVKETLCVFCGQSLMGKSGKKYCSLLCSAKDRHRKILDVVTQMFESGNTNGNLNLLKHAKKVLIELRGYECESCHNTQWLGQPVPLELEHVDGNHENNLLKNLKLLCPNCHALTPTYKSKNKGHGRAKRRERYRQGKSY
jgi:predicted nucleic acid-binding Zn ribbon protein